MGNWYKTELNSGGKRGVIYLYARRSGLLIEKYYRIPLIRDDADNHNFTIFKPLSDEEAKGLEKRISKKGKEFLAKAKRTGYCGRI